MLDIIIGLLMLLSAFASLHSKDLLKSGVFFVVFGFMSGLLWIRLSAPDIAMVEIILGSAITSILIFKLSRGVRDIAIKPKLWRRLWAGAGSLMLFVFLTFYLFTVREEERVGGLVFEKLSLSGVESPVTAVLLNFRGYDTLLEVGVITLAVIGILALEPKRKIYEWNDIVVWRFSKIFLPIIALFSLYITYLGAFSVGGAFQGGSLLAGGLAFLSLSGQKLPIRENPTLFLAMLSLAVFVAFAFVYALVGHGFLTYPLELSTLSIMLIEISICISTGMLLYIAIRGRL